ncbi:MAG: hypothetical protein KKF48_03670 [Nanoarchaeota archaeon]|nr:hypothetical protein [Nanoarchaeota archaeon]MBU1028118.1 hypothetical protein [Nanoarchaeota archaeon]
MDFYTWIITNKELFKIFYALIILIICIVIVLKTNRLFKLSLHPGIRYFRNAFFFYGIGFLIRYFIGTPFVYENILPNSHAFINLAFEFFLVMGGFFLLYSLLWKRFETDVPSFSSLFNSRILILYAITIIAVILDSLWKMNYIMFVSQIIIFIFASVISYSNLIKSKNKHMFLKYYFTAMSLSLIAWILNALAALYFEWNNIILVNIYVLNMIVFLLFLYGVIKVTKT